MFHKAIFQLGHLIKRPQVLRHYDEFQKTQWLSFEQLRERQEEHLRKLINFVNKNVPYYTRIFNELGLKPADVTGIQDLERLPILTKQTIKQNWQDFFPPNRIDYMDGSTSGSTGEPLKYRMSKEDYERGIALLYRGWGYGGYKLGDRVAVIAGSSLIPTAGSTARKKLQDHFLGRRSYSSFDMSEEALFRYLKSINRFKPRFIRGYASSIYLFAHFIRSTGLPMMFQPQAIFTTAEKLLDRQREVMEEVFGAIVFDNYGLNDGGVSAFECEAHAGMHIDMERAILEVVDEEGKQIINKTGGILATSLYNYAFPFIRYDTGDLGMVSNLKCICGRGTPLLKEIVGRTNDFITAPSGLRIHSGFFSSVVKGLQNVRQFQIIQNQEDRIVLNIVPDVWEDQKLIDVNKIESTIAGEDNQLRVEINLVREDAIEYTPAGKYKFIISTIKVDRV